MAALFHTPFALFVAQAAIIIASARLVGLAARRLGQPMVIAEVVAGILLGPSLLGLCSPRALGLLFPPDSLAFLNLFSTVGLVLFMFLVGLELDPALLRGHGRRAIIISNASIALPCALGGVLGLYVYPRLAPAGVPFSSFVLFMALAMSVTAFPVLARILSERRLLRTKVGAVTITCAAVDDVSAWCLLAFVICFVRSTNPLAAIRTTALAAAYIAAMILVVRPFLRRLAASSDDAQGVSQNRVAVALLLLLASSWTTELIGIHALFGAFVLGAIMPKEGSFARVLCEKLEDLVVVFLLPLFFAYSGLRTQIGLLDSLLAWGVCLLLTVVACVGKFGGGALAARLTGLSWRESSALGILMNTRGLMELIVLNIGLDLGVISPLLFTMLVIMALVTTFMTTPILQWVYPLEHLMKELVLAEPGSGAPLATGAPSFTVVMCVAYPRSGPGLVTVASALTRRAAQDARIYALRLVPPADRGSELGALAAERRVAETLEPLLARAESLDVVVRPITFVSSRPAQDICSVADVKNAQLVLLGWHKPILSRTVLGGTVQEVMKGARADVAVFVDRGIRKIQNVLVPYQGTRHDLGALRLARRLADEPGVMITILHVVTPERGGVGARGTVDEAFVDEGGGQAASVIMKLVNHATPTEAAIEEAKKGYDLVIIGAGEEWGLEQRLFGLLPEAIVADCPTSLLIVRAFDGVREASPALSRARERYPTGAALEHSSVKG